MNRAIRVVEDLNKTMKLLKASLRGIPFRTGSFHKQHDNLAREVARLTVELETVQARIK